MVINFFCHLRRVGVRPPRHVIFTTEESLRDRFTALGLTAFYHEGLGESGGIQVQTFFLLGIVLLC